MALLTTIIALLMVAVIIFLIIWLVLVSNKSVDEEDRPICINFMADKAEGRMIGVEKSLIKGAGDRYVVEMDPRDFMPKNAKKAMPVKYVVDKNKIVMMPKGAPSAERNVHIHLPRSAEDFPAALKATPFGKCLMFYTEVMNAENTEISAIAEGSTRKTSHIKKLGDGEVSERTVEVLDMRYNEFLKSVIEQKSKEKVSTGTSTPPGFSSNTQ